MALVKLCLRWESGDASRRFSFRLPRTGGDLRGEVDDSAAAPVYAVQKELAQDALRFAHPSAPKAQVPAPAFAPEPVRRGLIRRGADRFLTLTPVTLDLPGRRGNPDAGAGIGFELADGSHLSLFNFTIDWPLATRLIHAARPEGV